jgi:hypothetical protein
VLIADVSELLIGSIFIGIHLPMKMEPIRSSETLAIKNQTPGNYPKRNILQSKHGKSLNTDWKRIAFQLGGGVAHAALRA